MKILSGSICIGFLVAAGAIAGSAVTMAQAPGAGFGPRGRMEATGGPAVGDPVPRMELLRLDADAASPGAARVQLADRTGKRPVVLIFSSFT